MPGKKDAEKKEDKALATKVDAPLATRKPVGPQQDPLAKDETPQVSIPRIVLVQALSGEATREENPITPGNFTNRLTGENLGKKFHFVGFEHFLTRIRMEPGAGLKCRSVDMQTAQLMGGMTAGKKPTNNCSDCVYRLWPEERMALTGEDLQGRELTGGPACSRVDNYLAMQVDRQDGRTPWQVLQFQRTSAKAARDINGMWLDSERPLEDFAYALISTPVKGERNYFRADVQRVRQTTDEEKAAVQTWRQRLGKVDVVDVAEEEAAGDSLSAESKERVAAQKGF